MEKEKVKIMRNCWFDFVTSYSQPYWIKWSKNYYSMPAWMTMFGVDLLTRFSNISIYLLSNSIDKIYNCNRIICEIVMFL